MSRLDFEGEECVEGRLGNVKVRCQQGRFESSIEGYVVLLVCSTAFLGG
jgi:hypothetical protein